MATALATGTVGSAASSAGSVAASLPEIGSTTTGWAGVGSTTGFAGVRSAATVGVDALGTSTLVAEPSQPATTAADSGALKAFRRPNCVTIV